MLNQEGNNATLEVAAQDYSQLLQIIESTIQKYPEWEVVSQNLSFWDSPYRDIDGEMTAKRNYKGKLNFQRKVPIPIDIPPPSVVRFILPPLNIAAPIEKSLYKTALIIPDSQNGYRRDPHTGYLDPFHDRSAWAIALSLAAEVQPDVIVILGDMMDFPEWSTKYIISPDMRQTTQATIDELAWTLARLRCICPESRIVYIEGNHEERMQRAFLQLLPAAYGMKSVSTDVSVWSIRHLLSLDSLNIEYYGPYPNGIFYLNEELACIHGDMVRGGGAAATAKALLKDAHCSWIYGHLHKTELVHRTVHHKGKQIIRAAFCPGSISRIDGAVPSNSSRVDWQQGLALVHYDPDGVDFQIEPVAIRNSISIWRGQKIEGIFPLEELRQDTCCSFY